MTHSIEAKYPISFRQKEASELGAYIKQNQSVVLVGMKRVGINNFLRFFLNHEGISSTYINSKDPQLFIKIDLNDLIERNLSAFWTLLLTRLVDCVQNSTMKEIDKRACRRLFVQSIQLKDHFFTMDSVRKVLEAIAHAGLNPTLFLIRFDRLAEVVTPEFFSNIVGLRDAVNKKLTYVITSFRPLADLAPTVFTRQLLSVFAKEMYLTPTTQEDSASIIDTLIAQHHMLVSDGTKKNLLELSGGYVQYLQLALIRLAEEKNIPESASELKDVLTHDEQIVFQSEELFDSLTKKEKDAVLLLKAGNKISKSEREDVLYLWNTGMVIDSKNGSEFFSPLFDAYVGTLSMTVSNAKEFTKKEHRLFTYLSEHLDQLCERDAIIEAVWPEHQELGVSDWAIDRLVARLRSKLKTTSSPYSVVTVVTRGYKLIKS